MDQMPSYAGPFEQPQDLDGRIWRYMDLSKFLSLLQGNLYFPRADQLGDDDYECTIPRGNIKQLIESRALLSDEEKKQQDMLWPEMVNIRQADMTYLADQVRQTCYVSCWHLNQFESAAMWKLYLTKNEGVAVRSTTRRLLAVTAKYRGAMPDGHYGYMGVGKVKYIDFEDEAVPLESAYHIVMHKRKSFRHEQELRAVYHAPHRRGAVCKELGHGLAIDLSMLIEHVFIAPTAPSWFEDLVRDLVQQRFGLDLPVSRSAMARGLLR